MKPITELHPLELLDASICESRCPEHECYSIREVHAELVRRLSDGYTTSLRKRAEEQQQSAEHRLLVNADLQRKIDMLKAKLNVIRDHALAEVPRVASIIEECDRP